MSDATSTLVLGIDTRQAVSALEELQGALRAFKSDALALGLNPAQGMSSELASELQKVRRQMDEMKSAHAAALAEMESKLEASYAKRERASAEFAQKRIAEERQYNALMGKEHELSVQGQAKMYADAIQQAADYQANMRSVWSNAILKAVEVEAEAQAARQSVLSNAILKAVETEKEGVAARQSVWSNAILKAAEVEAEAQAARQSVLSNAILKAVEAERQRGTAVTAEAISNYNRALIAQTEYLERQKKLNAAYAQASLSSRVSKTGLAAELVAGGNTGLAYMTVGSEAVKAIPQLAAMKAEIAAVAATNQRAAATSLEHAAALRAQTAMMKDAHSAARGMAGAFGATWLTWGNIVPLAAFAALGAALRESTKLGSQLEYQLAFVKGLSGATRDEVSLMSEMVQRQAGRGLFGTTELGQGLRILSQAGLDASQSMLVLRDTTNLATVGEMSMEKAAITLVGVMNAFDLSIKDVPHVGDVFSKAAAVSQTSVEQMTEAMRTASVAGAMYGATMEDTAAALTVLAKINVTGTAAGTSFRNMLKELYAPTKDVQEVMRKIGFSVLDAQGHMKSFATAIYELKGKLEQYDKIGQINILQKLFGERGAKEAVAMLALSREEWDKLNRTISESSGFASRVAAELESTAQGQWKQAVNTLESSFVQAFKNSDGALKDLAKSLKDIFGSPEFVNGVSKFVSGVAMIAKALVELAGPITAGIAMWGTYKVAMLALASPQVLTAFSALSAAMIGITLPAAGVAAVIAGVVGACALLWKATSGPEAKTAAQVAKDNSTAITEALKKEADQAQEAYEKYLALNKVRGVGGEYATQEGALQSLREKIEALKTAKQGLENSDPSRTTAYDMVGNWFNARKLGADIKDLEEQLKAGEADLVRLKKFKNDLAFAQSQQIPEVKTGIKAGDKKIDLNEKVGALDLSQKELDRLKKIVEVQTAQTDALEKYGSAKDHVHRAEVEALVTSTAWAEAMKKSHKEMKVTEALLLSAADKADAATVKTREFNQAVERADKHKEGAAKTWEHAKAIFQFGESAKESAVKLEQLWLATEKHSKSLSAASKNNLLYEAAMVDMADAYESYAKVTEKSQKEVDEAQAEGKLLFIDSEREKIRVAAEATNKLIEFNKQRADAAYDAGIAALQSGTGLLSKEEYDKYLALVDHKEAVDKAYATAKQKLAESTNAKIATAELKEYKSTVTKIDEIAHQGFNKIFERTSGGWKGMLETMRSTFKSMLLEYIYKEFAKPIVLNLVGNVAGMFGQTNLANTAMSMAGGSGSFLGSVGGNAGGSFLGDGLLSMGSSSLLSGASMGGFFTGAGAALTNGVGVMGNLSAASSLIGTGTAGGISTGIGMAMPYVTAALVIADAAGLFDKHGGPQSGQYGSISASGYKSSFTMSGGDSLGNQTLAQSAYNQVASLFALAGKQGSALQVNQGYKLDPNGSASGVAYRDIIINGKTITGGTFDGNNGGQWYGANNDGAGAANYLGKLTTSEIKKLVEAIDDSGLSTLIEKLSKNFTDLADGLAKYATAQAQQKSMLSSLMTESERQAQTLADAQTTLQNTFAALGHEVPKTTAEMKAYIQSLDLTTKAGQEAMNALNGAAAAINTVAAASMKIEQTRVEWQIKLDVLQGKYTQTQLERFFTFISTTDEATKAIEQQVWALEDQQAAAKTAAEAIKKMTDYAKTLSDTVESLKMGDMSPLTNGQKLAEAETQYSITLAQAKAGSASAQNNLSSVAQTYLTSARDYYASSPLYTQIFNAVISDLDRLSKVAASGGLQSFAVGINEVPEDMRANIHKGERILPAADNRELMRRLAEPPKNDDALISEMRALREEVRQLRAESTRNAGLVASSTERAAADNAERVAGAVERSSQQRRSTVGLI